MVYKLGLDALQFLLPTSCQLCKAPTREGLSLCSGCICDLPRLHTACSICALPLGTAGICGQCLQSPPAFDATFSACLYQPPASQLVQRLKYHHRFDIAHLFASLMQPIISSMDNVPDLLIPVPLHHARARRRGYNQAWELARRLSKACGIPADASLLQRIRATPSQTGLSFRQRKQNLRNAFRVRGDMSDLHVAVVDDVMTTGSTLQAIAETLKRSGVQKVTGLVVARAERHR